tara:strand:- start:759 stop:1148 length:390 start_codon:yes stop_codon:yes gene_type:complete
MKDFGNAILKGLFVDIIFNYLKLPLKIVGSSVSKINSSDGSNSSEFVVLVWFKNFLDAIIVLFYPIAVIYIIWMYFELGDYFYYEDFIYSVIATYFGPISIGFVKEILSIAIVKITKIEQIEKNTNKDI